MRILLITPPFYRILGMYNRYFPFGITLLGTLLEKKGHKVWVYDADFCDDPESIDYSQMSSRYGTYLKSFEDKKNKVWMEVENKIKKFKPDLVGISVYTPFVASAFFVAKKTKKILPRAKVVMGGPHITVKADEVDRICPDFDYLVKGEAEKTFLKLVDDLSKGGAISQKIIEGGFDNNKTDDFVMPDRELLVNKSRLSSEDMGLIMTSRGCPYRCTYCASMKGLRLRPVDKVIEEIVLVHRKYGTNQFTFKDDSFTVDRERVMDLCDKLIDLDLGIKWECNTRVNLIDEELLRVMKKAGCNFVKVGVESGSEKILKKMNKGITLFQVEKAADLFRKVGIHWSGYFMMGVVGETEKDIRKTVKFIKKIRPDLTIMAVYEPFPGTAMYQEGIEKGLIKDKMSYDDFYRITPDNYYKADPRVQNDKISPKSFKELEKEVMEFVRKYNLRPENVLRMVLSKLGVYTREPKIFFEDGRKFLKYYWGKLS